MRLEFRLGHVFDWINHTLEIWIPLEGTVVTKDYLLKTVQITYENKTMTVLQYIKTKKLI